MENDLLTVAQAAEALDLLPGTIRDQIAKGRITPLRFGGHGTRAGILLIPRAQVERYRAMSKGRRGRPPKRHAGAMIEGENSNDTEVG